MNFSFLTPLAAEIFSGGPKVVKKIFLKKCNETHRIPPLPYVTPASKGPPPSELQWTTGPDRDIPNIVMAALSSRWQLDTHRTRYAADTGEWRPRHQQPTTHDKGAHPPVSPGPGVRRGPATLRTRPRRRDVMGLLRRFPADGDVSRWSPRYWPDLVSEPLLQTLATASETATRVPSSIPFCSVFAGLSPGVPVPPGLRAHPLSPRGTVAERDGGAIERKQRTGGPPTRLGTAFLYHRVIKGPGKFLAKVHPHHLVQKLAYACVHLIFGIITMTMAAVMWHRYRSGGVLGPPRAAAPRRAGVSVVPPAWLGNVGVLRAWATGGEVLERPYITGGRRVPPRLCLQGIRKQTCG